MAPAGELGHWSDTRLSPTRDVNRSAGERGGRVLLDRVKSQQPNILSDHVGKIEQAGACDAALS